MCALFVTIKASVNVTVVANIEIIWVQESSTGFNGVFIIKITLRFFALTYKKNRDGFETILWLFKTLN